MLVKLDADDSLIESVEKFITQGDDQAIVDWQRLSLLIEFVTTNASKLKKDKNASHNINLVLRPKEKNLQVRPKTELKDHSDDLLKFVAFKLTQRLGKMSQVFRYFDVKNKNKIRFSDLKKGFEQLNLNLSSSDLESVWS